MRLISRIKTSNFVSFTLSAKVTVELFKLMSKICSLHIAGYLDRK